MTSIIPSERAPRVAADAPIAETHNTSGPRLPTRRPRAWKALLRRPLAAISIAYLLVLVTAALAASVVAPYDPHALDLHSVLSGPTSDHLLGTDPLGRDVLSRVIYGGRISIVNAGIAAVTFLLIGTTSGLVAGFRGGWTDRIFTWVVDIIIAVPALIVLLVVLAIFGSNMIIAMIALGALAAPGFARVIRGATLAVRQELYIAAARVTGLRGRRIVIRHVLPRVMGPILVQVSLFCGAALLVDAGLAYLGFGVQPPTPTWGGMIVEASTVMQRQPWLLIPPGVILGLATLAFALLGDSIRDTTAERAGRAPTRMKREPRQAHVSATVPSWHPDASVSSLLSMRHVSIVLPTSDGTAPVVENLSLEIQSGETVGLVGESGCGKSITGSAVLGLLPAGGRVVAGDILFAGTNLTAVSTRTIRGLRGSKIALVSQEPIASLDPMFTVGQQLSEMVRRHRGGERRFVRDRMLELLDSVSLPEPARVARRYPHELSGGMAQRVAIAIALAGEPELLIADEPTTALDVTVQAEILRLLGRLQAERGMAILLISHDWGVIAQTCQRAYVMYAGQVVESCTVIDMFDHPSHPYTTGLLGSTPRRGRPGEHLTAIRGSVPAPGAWPSGCHFAPRCDLAVAECRESAVPLLEASPGHQTRCIRHTELLTGGQDD